VSWRLIVFVFNLQWRRYIEEELYNMAHLEPSAGASTTQVSWQAVGGN